MRITQDLNANSFQAKSTKNIEPHSRFIEINNNVAYDIDSGNRKKFCIQIQAAFANKVYLLNNLIQ